MWHDNGAHIRATRLSRRGSTHGHARIGFGYVNDGRIELFSLIVRIADNDACQRGTYQHDSGLPHFRAGRFLVQPERSTAFPKRRNRWHLRIARRIWSDRTFPRRSRMYHLGKLYVTLCTNVYTYAHSYNATPSRQRGADIVTVFGDRGNLRIANRAYERRVFKDSRVPPSPPLFSLTRTF